MNEFRLTEPENSDKGISCSRFKRFASLGQSTKMRLSNVFSSKMQRMQKVVPLTHDLLDRLPHITKFAPFALHFMSAANLSEIRVKVSSNKNKQTVTLFTSMECKM